jgi:hypothetical protein
MASMGQPLTDLEADLDLAARCRIAGDFLTVVADFMAVAVDFTVAPVDFTEVAVDFTEVAVDSMVAAAGTGAADIDKRGLRGI